MRRLVVSAIYTLALFFASFIVVALVVRGTGLDEQARFFYFQAIFYVLSTVASQSLTLSLFRNTSARMAGLIMDVAALVSVVLFLTLSSRLGFGLMDQICFAVATVLLYRSSTLLNAVQFHSRNAPALLWVPILTMTLRVLAAWGLSGQGAAPMFLANGIAAFAVPALVLLLGVVKDDGRDKAPAPTEAANSRTFVFFLVGAATFQWERVLYGALDAQESLILTGYVFAVVLPPLSSLFATLYRGFAREIFADQDHHLRQRVFLRVGGSYAALCGLYLIFLVVFWPQIMALLGAKILPDPWLALVLGAAIVVDRLANLMVFLDPSSALYARASLTKGPLVILAFALTYAYGSATLALNYWVFLSVVVVYFAAVVTRRK